MTTGQALFQAILDEPDADEPRLVYADWLEENGDPDRAEFIRVSVRLYRRGKARHSGGDPDCIRYGELHRKYREQWLAEMPRLREVRWWAFWRGFPTIQVDGYSTLKEHATKIWRASPCEEVCFHLLTEPGGRFLGASPWLDRIRVMQIGVIGRNFLPGFRSLLKSPRLAALRWLDLKSAILRDEGARLLAECPYLTNLEVLYLECCEIGPEGARAMARTPHFPNLKRLVISRNPIGRDESVVQELKKRWGQRCSC